MPVCHDWPQLILSTIQIKCFTYYLCIALMHLLIRNIVQLPEPSGIEPKEFGTKSNLQPYRDDSIFMIVYLLINKTGLTVT